MSFDFFEDDIILYENQQPIIELMREDNQGQSLDAHISLNRLFINSPRNNLLIRFNSYNKTLVIADIFFNRRQGYGTRLLEILNEFAKKHGYKKLMLEFAHTEQIRMFALKRGFRLIDDDPNDRYQSNWYLQI